MIFERPQSELPSKEKEKGSMQDPLPIVSIRQRRRPRQAHISLKDLQVVSPAYLYEKGETRQ
jgi:hypothetical protein